MRELKFRAWDQSENKMLPGIELGRMLRQVTNPHDNSVGGDAVRGHELVWLQYTGLKDKNGVEIYKGDILRHNHKDVIDIDSSFYCEVVWKDYGWFMLENWKRGKLEEYVNMPLSSSHIENWEVIGNIYKNPELLKDAV